MNFLKNIRNLASLAGMLILLILSCSVNPQPIDYGASGCTYCSMTIVDKQHASQLVTEKGKAYNFDAIECMLNYLKEEPLTPIGLYLVNDFMAPGELIDGSKSTFLISEAIPSPMGSFLTALKSNKEAQTLLDQYGGEIYSWEEIREKFSQPVRETISQYPEIEGFNH